MCAKCIAQSQVKGLQEEKKKKKKKDVEEKRTGMTWDKVKKTWRTSVDWDTDQVTLIISMDTHTNVGLLYGCLAAN